MKRQESAKAGLNSRLIQSPEWKRALSSMLRPLPSTDRVPAMPGRRLRIAPNGLGGTPHCLLTRCNGGLPNSSDPGVSPALPGADAS